MAYKNFISKMYVQEMTILKSEDNTKARLENIAWPSECSADLGPYTVGECKRSLFYKILGVTPTEDFSLRGSFICDAGLMYEKYHTERFKSLGLLKDDQLRIQFQTNTSNKILIAGKIDCVIEDSGSRKGIEIKSVSAFKAPEIFGFNGKLPLPAANNLMQAMLYKHWTVNTDQGKESGIDEVYLMYINRSDNSTCWFKVNLDEQGYPIITAIDQVGREVYTMKLQEQKSFTDLLNMAGEGDPEQARIAELRISTNDIFKKFNDVYDNVKTKVLPAPDYKQSYNQEDIDRDVKCGRLTKRKLTAMKKNGETKSDYKCGYCSYMKKCLSDNGVNLVTF